MIFSKIANLASEIQRFGQVSTGNVDGNSSNLLLDMSRNIGQPVEFYLRGGAWDPLLTAKLIGLRKQQSYVHPVFHLSPKIMNIDNKF